MTPEAVADEMVRTIACEPSTWKVLDPACGDGNLLVVAARELMRQGVTDIHQRIAGIDVDPSMLVIARKRLSDLIGCDPDEICLSCQDFLKDPIEDLSFNVVLSNPPYGGLREYRFFERAHKAFDTELVFLVPLSFLDRVEGVKAVPLKGRPLGVTTGHAVVHHHSGKPYRLRSVKGRQENGTAFSVVVGLKLYEVGAGTPPQTWGTVAEKPFSSAEPRPGWLACLRTGDVHPNTIETGRLWVDYGPHLAHPKDLERFQGPRVLVRRIPIWGTRRLAAAYVTDQVLCTSDILIVRSRTADEEQLRGLCVFLNSEEAARFVLEARPSARYRDSYPKVSAKDLDRLLHEHVPASEILAQLSSEEGRP